MIRKVIVICALFIMLTVDRLLADSSYCSYDSTKVIRFMPQNDDHVNVLKDLASETGYQINVWVKPTMPFAPVLFAARSEVARYLKAVANNWTMPYEVVVHNMQHAIIKLDRNNTMSTGPKYMVTDEINTFDHGKYHDLNEINNFMEALVHSCKRFGILCYLEPIGYTAERKLINAIRIGGSDQKTLMIEAGMHAREWATVNVALYTAYELITQSNDGMKDFLENVTWYIIPVVNMDGYEYSWRKDRTWRKNTVKCRAETLDCRACTGVDLNRNFDVHWNESQVCDDMPCCSQYPGQQPATESEVRALADYIKRKNVNAYISLHSYGQRWTYPYLYAKRRYPKNAADMHEIAEAAVMEIENKYGINYTIGSSADVMYEASGSSTDWVIDQSNASSLVFLVETRPHRGSGDFCLPEEELAAVNSEILTGIKVVAKYLSTGTPLTKYKKLFGFNGAPAVKWSTANHLFVFLSMSLVAISKILV